MIVGALSMARAESVDFYRTSGVFFSMSDVKYCEIPQRGTNWNKYFQVLDVLYIDRRFVAEATGLIKAAKSNGIKVCVDMDDDVFNLSPYHDAYAQLSNPNVQANIKAAIQEADILTVTTEALKALYSPLNDNIHVIPNAWNDYAHGVAKIKPTRKKPQIAWRGTNSHRRDVFEVHTVVNKHLNNFTWMFYGVAFECIQEGFGMIPFQELYTYFSAFAANAPDYVFVPLENTKFNQAKSNIAYIEAAMLAGSVVIAPVQMTEFNMPGVIQYSGLKGLDRVLTDIKANKYDREALARDAQEYIQNNLRLSVINETRHALLNSLVQKPLMHIV